MPLYFDTMIAVLQRVTQAQVTVDENIVGKIGTGLLVLLGVEKNDEESQAHRMAERILGYRIFPDDEDKMNNNVVDIAGGVLIVPQFTLAADTKKGMRPSFSTAAPPESANKLYESVVKAAKKAYSNIETGSFQANMQVSLCNDGPVTIVLKS